VLRNYYIPCHECLSSPQATRPTRNIVLDTNLLNRDNRHEDHSRLRGTITMLNTLYQFRHVSQLACTLLTLIVAGLRYLGFCLHSRSALAAENLFLRKQLALYQERHVKPRRATNATRIALVWLGRWFDWRPALTLVQPKTFIRWHRQAFRLLWRWKSRPGRLPIPLELQRSSARWLGTIRRGARSALPTSCCSSSAFGYRHEPFASICRHVWTEAPVSACSASAGRRLCATTPR
jgi:hypothetical protein